MQRRFSLSLLALCALLAACGGGGAPEEVISVVPNSGGSGDIPAGASVGPITAAQPLTVADVAWRTDGVTVQVADGDDDGRGALPGMIGRAEGGLDAGGRGGRATMASTQAELRGPVTAVGNGGFTVLGQTVQVNATTVLDGLSGLPLLGERVQVHGLIAPGDSLQATRVQRRAAGDSVLKLVGRVSYANCPNCLPSGSRFGVGGLLVRADEAQLQGLSLPIAPGTMVRVRANALPDGGELRATAISNYLATPLLADATTRVRGIVTEPIAGTLSVQGLTLTLGSPLSFENGSAADLGAGRAVTLEGRYRNGGLWVLKVRFD
jgi:Domain of unknown function (DUF5666)